MIKEIGHSEKMGLPLIAIPEATESCPLASERLRNMDIDM
jgi:hypothetical protein